MQNDSKADGLTYYREGGHYIILRETEIMLEVLEFFHQNSNLPYHLEKLTNKAPSVPHNRP